jgi:hypothetical protein
MKTFIAAAVAAVTVIALPSAGEAASKTRHKHPKPHASAHYERMPTYINPRTALAHSPNPGWDVYRNNGEYAGSDPDPRVRMMLKRDRPGYYD